MVQGYKVRSAGIITASLVGVLALAACGDGGNTTPAKSNVDLLKAAVTNMKTVKSFNYTSTTEVGGNTIKLTGDVDNANKKYKVHTDVAGQAKDIIVIGADTFESADGGKTYQKSTTDMSQSFKQFESAWTSTKLEDIDKAKDTLKDANPATEKMGTVDTKHIQTDAKSVGSLSTAGDTSVTMEGPLDIWVSTDATPYVYKMILDAKVSGSPIKSTQEWSNFNKAFDIQTPATSFERVLEVAWLNK